ncbi:unnamed protein product [Phytophthora fragariaefolia]|uniref:Unnamed protein product n=1 Tax=Phytophthora fragariaefolia TaxID=1490495 RepID=A0A9W6Y1A0_9STRA|nr:unnamed protein product [Phytophthora fragariaefolia]
MTTPEGLAVARGILQRAIDITSRRADRTSEQTWSDAPPRSAPPVSDPTAVRGDTGELSLDEAAPRARGKVTRPTPSPNADVPTPHTEYGTPSLGLGNARTTLSPQLPSVPMWTTTPASGGAAQTPDSWPTPRLRTAIAAYGGYALQGVTTPKDPKGSGLPAPTPTTGLPVSTPAIGTDTVAYRFSGMPSHIKNAVRMIQPFYSDNSTVDKARACWVSFERATVGLEESLRLSAFRECLKGKTGEEWWMYSRIDDFETLRVRFHNQCICLTPLQMIEHLKNTKSSRGMSAEVWGDLIQGLCDEAQCFDPRMHYQYFLLGLRNKEWKTALSTAMVNSIPQAVAVYLYKNIHIPMEDDADFTDVASSASKNATTEGSLLTQMMQMLQANQNLILQQQRELAQSPRSPRRSGYAAAAYENAASSVPSPSYPQGEESVAPPSRLWNDAGGYIARVSLNADVENWDVPANEEETGALLTFDYNEELAVNTDDNVDVWDRDDEASTVRYGEELTTLETAYRKHPMTMGYVAPTEESQPREQTTCVLVDEEVAYGLEDDEIVNEEPSERAIGSLTTEEVALDLEQPYLRTEEPSERAIGTLTTEEVALDLENYYLRIGEPSESATGGLLLRLMEKQLEKLL